MTFLSITYGLFLLSTLGIYWSVEGRSLRLWVLLLASVVFYCSLEIQFMPLLLGMTLITYWIGRAIGSPLDWRVSNQDWEFAEQDWNRRRFALLWVGIILNLLMLLGFKYVPFLLESIGGLGDFAILWPNLNWVNFSWVNPTWPQVTFSAIPFTEITAQADWIRKTFSVLGISFFSFECIAYLVDVYRGAIASRDFLEFATYKLFFPKLISGPITRFHPFIAQFQTLHFPVPSQISEGLWLIACGAIKKLLLADHLATVVNLIFGSVERAGSGDLWLAILAYGFQLYLDFSGYVDVARGTAILLGFELPQNFDFPYFCTNIADFWRRWHMTLGDWLRNYLYFPLGGSRKGLVITCVNLMIVMLLAGIWHGDAWGFIVWGVLHGLALIIHRLTDSLSRDWRWLAGWWRSLPGTVLAWMMTQSMVFMAWIFFRLPNLKDSGLVLQRLWGHPADIQFAPKIYGETLQSDRLEITVMIGLLFIGMGIAYSVSRGLKLQLSWVVKLLLVPVCIYLAWLLAPNESAPYIYFNY
jgi:alginate O-acetyltransferase complex protein AlgI